MSFRNHIRKFWVAIITILTVAAAAGGYSFYWAEVLHKFTTVTENKVYRSMAMPLDSLKKTLLTHDINTVIDLRNAVDGAVIESERRLVESLGKQYYNVPSNQIPKPETISSFVEILDREDTYPVLIHCKHGEGRAVLFSAIYRIEYEGWNGNDARSACRIITWESAFDSSAPKGKYLNEYVSRSQKTK